MRLSLIRLCLKMHALDSTAFCVFLANLPPLSDFRSASSPGPLPSILSALLVLSAKLYTISSVDCHPQVPSLSRPTPVSTSDYTCLVEYNPLLDLRYLLCFLLPL
ncbi:hypothetical protein FA13DRAFT_1176087 [Coprinellus micaceus]|uniref:Uncharacterized protein n=1 Tax=Coprinellus micaceus TaxID=71717 RepID=A0A4Y7SVJ5_COPMI|nr:hypothetical protein FA13DRAFT_1176087 [Coprinellus micaceus]